MQGTSQNTRDKQHEHDVNALEQQARKTTRNSGEEGAEEQKLESGQMADC